MIPFSAPTSFLAFRSHLDCNISLLQQQGDGNGLYWGHPLKAHLPDKALSPLAGLAGPGRAVTQAAHQKKATPFSFWGTGKEAGTNLLKRFEKTLRPRLGNHCKHHCKVQDHCKQKKSCLLECHKGTSATSTSPTGCNMSSQ